MSELSEREHDDEAYWWTNEEEYIEFAPRSNTFINYLFSQDNELKSEDAFRLIGLLESMFVFRRDASPKFRKSSWIQFRKNMRTKQHVTWTRPYLIRLPTLRIPVAKSIDYAVKTQDAFSWLKSNNYISRSAESTLIEDRILADVCRIAVKRIEYLLSKSFTHTVCVELVKDPDCASPDVIIKIEYPENDFEALMELWGRISQDVSSTVDVWTRERGIPSTEQVRISNMLSVAMIHPRCNI